MRTTLAIFRREFVAYFATPLAYVFIVIFLAVAGALTFYVGGFFERGQADLYAFFVFHPWLYLFFVPAVAMRLWAEERRSGTIELLMTLPVTTWQAVLGKFLAAWLFTGVALVLTFPMWVTVNYLGEPDNGVILASYLASWLLAGAFIAIGSCMSAVTKSQVIAFVLGAVSCFIFLMSGVDLVLSPLRAVLPPFAVELVGGFSFLFHFNELAKGVIGASSALFFASVTVLALIVNALIVELEKAA